MCACCERRTEQVPLASVYIQSPDLCMIGTSTSSLVQYKLHAHICEFRWRLQLVALDKKVLSSELEGGMLRVPWSRQTRKGTETWTSFPGQHQTAHRVLGSRKCGKRHYKHLLLSL